MEGLQPGISFSVGISSAGSGDLATPFGQLWFLHRYSKVKAVETCVMLPQVVQTISTKSRCPSRVLWHILG
jgi:hypothetical protein